MGVLKASVPLFIDVTGKKLVEETIRTHRGVADAIETGVLMDRAQRRRRMHLVRSILRRYDIFWWVDTFLDAAFAMHLEDFPPYARDAWDAPDSVQGPPWDLPGES